MADLVEVLLQGARAGAFDVSVEIDVDAELAAMAIRWQAAAKAANVRVELDARSKAIAKIDPRALSIAAGNLVHNAIAHSPAGGLVTVRAAPREEGFRIEVDDQGPGVPAEDRSRIFAPFTRTESSTGAGLGLSIARRIVEAHRGRIGVEDAARGGARFTIELPAR
jgi:signal transduction histidine kinase